MHGSHPVTEHAHTHPQAEIFPGCAAARCAFRVLFDLDIEFDEGGWVEFDPEFEYIYISANNKCNSANSLTEGYRLFLPA